MIAYFKYFILFSIFLLSACGFHLQGNMHLAKPLHRLYLKTDNPYGQLASGLKQYLRMSHVILVSSPHEGETILTILQNSQSKNLLSVNSTTQTRQYALSVTVIFSITDTFGHLLLDPELLSESKVITVQANQVMGTSNEANLYFYQMRRTLIDAIMKRISSRDASKRITGAYYLKPILKSS